MSGFNPANFGVTHLSNVHQQSGSLEGYVGVKLLKLPVMLPLTAMLVGMLL